MGGIGRTLVVLGLLIAGVGVLLILGDRLPFRLGRLPGDIVWKGKHTTFYFPLTTLILLNLLLSLILWVFHRR